MVHTRMPAIKYRRTLPIVTPVKSPIVGVPVEEEETAYLDFTTIIEAHIEDPEEWLTIETNTVTFDGQENADCRLCWDTGVAYFDGDFEVNFSIKVLTGASVAHRVCQFSNTEDDSRTLDNINDGLGIRVSPTDPTFRLNIEVDDAAQSSEVTAALDMNQTYFCTFTRDYIGTLATLSVYSDPDRTVLVDSVNANTDRDGVTDGLVPYRYFFPFNGYNIGDGDMSSMIVSDMTITPDLPD